MRAPLLGNNYSRNFSSIRSGPISFFRNTYMYVVLFCLVYLFQYLVFMIFFILFDTFYLQIFSKIVVHVNDNIGL